MHLIALPTSSTIQMPSSACSVPAFGLCTPYNPALEKGTSQAAIPNFTGCSTPVSLAPFAVLCQQVLIPVCVVLHIWYPGALIQEPSLGQHHCHSLCVPQLYGWLCSTSPMWSQDLPSIPNAGNRIFPPWLCSLKLEQVDS